MEGNNIAEFLSFHYPPLLDSFYAEYCGSSIGVLVGNVYGYENTFSEGEEFSYFTDAGLNYNVDIKILGYLGISRILYVNHQDMVNLTSLKGTVYHSQNLCF